MQVTIEKRGEVQVLQCEGRLTMTTAGRLREEVDQAVSNGGAKLVVDLERVSFVDSSGLGALISGLKRARQAGGDLRIARPGAQVQVVLQLTNLDRVLRPYDSVDGAVNGW